MSNPIELTVQSLRPVEHQSREVGEWLYNFLWDHTGDDCAFINFLGKRRESWPHHALDGDEFDRMEMFQSLITNLTILLGSEDAAAHWLFETQAFANVNGSTPFECLADGSFDALYFIDTLIQAELKENEIEKSRAHFLFRGSVAADHG